MPTPMSCFVSAATKYGGRSPADEDDVDRFFEETLGLLGPDVALSVLDELLSAEASEGSSNAHREYPIEPRLPALSASTESVPGGYGPSVIDVVDNCRPVWRRAAQAHVATFMVSLDQQLAARHHAPLSVVVAHRGEPYVLALRHALYRAATCEHDWYASALASCLVTVAEPGFDVSVQMLVDTVSRCSEEHLVLLRAVMSFPGHSAELIQVAERSKFSETMTDGIARQLRSLGVLDVAPSWPRISITRYGQSIAKACGLNEIAGLVSTTR